MIDPPRDIIERLEQAGIGYDVTGSEATAAHGLGYRLTDRETGDDRHRAAIGRS